MGYEGLCEVVISKLLEKSNIENYVPYFPVRITFDGKEMNGCYSREPLKIPCRAEVRKIYGRILSKRRRYTDVYQGVLAKLCREDFVLMCGRELLEVPSNNFRKKNESIVTLEHLSKQWLANSFAGELLKYEEPKDKIMHTVDFVEKVTKLEGVGEYLTTMLELDAFFLNEDRHILKKPYVIRFDANGGSGEMEDIVTLDSPVTMPECTFTAPEGKRFKAWSDGYGNTIEEDEEVGLTPGIYEYTITAVWADVYTITVADSTGGTIKTNKLEAIEGERVRLTLTPDTGYRIDQLYVSYNFNQHADVVNNSYFLMPATSVTVKAFWTQEHTITLDCWNCTAQTNLEKAFKGDTITVTVTPDDGCVLNSIDAYYYGEYHTLSGNTFTMPADDVTVYVNCLVGTPYIDGDGEEKLAAAYTFGMPSNVNSLWDHWYAVDEDIEFDHDVEIRGNVNLILCDGATLSFTKKEDDSDCGRFVFKGNSSLTIYGQSEGTGKFTCADNVGYMSIYSEPTDDYGHGVLTMNGGALEAKTFGQIIVDEVNINRGTVKNFCVYARGDITVNGGTIDHDVYSTGISSDEKDVRITGGDLYLRTTGASDAGIRAENNVTITGGRILIPETEGRGIYVHGESGQISLSWTSLSDSYDISTF